jgi:hypothetical protein
MKTLRELRQVEVNKDAEDFGRLVHHILRHRGNFSEARVAVSQGNANDMRGLTTRTIEILKAAPPGREISLALFQRAAQSAGTLAGTTALTDASIIVQGWINSLAAYGIFDKMLPSMVQVPLQPGTVGAVTVGATAYSVSEGGMKPMSRLTLSGAATAIQKGHVAVTYSQEVARSILLSTTNFVSDELRRALAVNVDSQFIANMISDITPLASSSTTGAGLRSDVEWALRQVRLDPNSKPFIVTTPQICETLSMMSNSGAPCFPELGPLGGFLAPGLPVLTSDITTGLVVLIDASRIAAASGDVVLQEFTEGSPQMNDAPDSPPSASTPFVSLWQMNEIGIRCERYFLAQKLRTDATAAILSSNSYSSGGSP